MGLTNTKIFIQEVSPRDGLQNEAVFVETEEKVKLINQLGDCGFAKVEVTSFTSPKAIPALRDAEEVMKQIVRNPRVDYTVLVPNVRGAERAMACNIDEANLVMSASESHNLVNLRMSRSDSMRQLKQIIDELSGTDIAINVSLSSVFGCPIEGNIQEEEILRLTDFFASQNVRGITLCDTTGMAYPTQVERVCSLMKRRFPQLELTLHFHDTRGMALANSLAGLNQGINRFDASLGGLGGCPYAPGASGNVCTEDMVHMFELMGLRTGVDVVRLLSIVKTLPQLIGHPTWGNISKAGRRLDLHPMPSSLNQDFTHSLTQHKSTT
ncbi:hydroxymethylglutaryl-CoA lyase [Rouxiella silvae]|uniref:Hydroxymethylglutaryl-CoA lyase n=1 Tax=Rouxiella silvae TaxID=1646373 RepID=A0AA40X2P2_9GAMM|nr:hydroxymethylglutaryl-CoA lyase [Rouxiella silvae]MBF6637582.1 hydroxymethylglutaryl-CoA lyase [Rouxiella silvae]ORJ21820.1 hydroxymethylglutaryl-CoA lyase [Rouxiella silvae]